MTTDKFASLRMRLTAIAATVALLLSAAGCDDDGRIPYRNLPEAARVFIETYFPAASCVYAEMDTDDGQRRYEVKLSDDTELEFDAAGQWLEIDCRFALIPDGILPQNIVDDVAERYPSSGIYKAERRTGGYEITVGYGIELIYSASGVFIREDRY